MPTIVMTIIAMMIIAMGIVKDITIITTKY
jgi:hypothetical protein